MGERGVLHVHRDGGRGGEAGPGAPAPAERGDQVRHARALREHDRELGRAREVAVRSEEESAYGHRCGPGDGLPPALLPRGGTNGSPRGQPAPLAPGPARFWRTSSAGPSVVRNCESSWCSREVEPRTSVRPSCSTVPITT